MHRRSLGQKAEASAMGTAPTEWVRRHPLVRLHRRQGTATHSQRGHVRSKLIRIRVSSRPGRDLSDYRTDPPELHGLPAVLLPVFRPTGTGHRDSTYSSGGRIFSYSNTRAAVRTSAGIFR